MFWRCVLVFVSWIDIEATDGWDGDEHWPMAVVASCVYWQPVAILTNCTQWTHSVRRLTDLKTGPGTDPCPGPDPRLQDPGCRLPVPVQGLHWCCTDNKNDERRLGDVRPSSLASSTRRWWSPLKGVYWWWILRWSQRSDWVKTLTVKASGGGVGSGGGGDGGGSDGYWRRLISR